MRTATKRILSFMLALAMLISLVPAVTPVAKAADQVFLEKMATPATELLYEENFDSYGNITLKSGVNEDVNLFVPSDTTAKIENGRLYLKGRNRTAYFLGGEMWSYYTVEADIGYISTEDYWGGLAFYVQSGTKWHKGNIRTKGEAKLNGHDGDWVNDGADNVVTLQDVVNNQPEANEPIRLKIVAEGTKATMYYARYTDGVRGEYKKVIEINNIPASCQSGSVGLAAGNGKTVWMDNLVVTRNLDQEKAKHILMSVDFDEYTGDNTATLVNGLNEEHYRLKYDKDNTVGSVELKDGRLYMSGNSSNYDYVYFDYPDAQHWTDYVVEADLCYTSSSGWYGLLYRTQDYKNSQKGGLYLDGRAGLNGYANGTWVNDDSMNGFEHKKPNAATVNPNEPHRIKIVAKGNTADLYWASYTDYDKREMGPWQWAVTINDIPNNQTSGSVGLMTSGSGTPVKFWMDNLVVYEYTNTYVEDFNRYSNTTLSTGVNEGINGVGMEVVRTASGGTIQVKDGVLDFKAADNSSTKEFDAAWFTAGKNWTNYTFEADVTYKNGGELSNGTQWGTLLYRVADKTSFQRGGLSYPKRVYLGGYESGWNPNQENVDKWYLDNDLPKDEPFRVKLVVEDRASYLYYALYNENGDLQPYTFVKSIKNIPGTQSKGTVGMLGALGVNFQVDNVVVAAGKPQDPAAATPTYGVADINIPETGIVNPPVVVMNVTKDNYSKIATDKPSVALMDIDSSMNIVHGTTEVAKAADFLTAHHATVIPAFRVDSSEEAQALITFLNENKVMDAFVVATSENAALIKTVRTACPKIRGILEYTSVLDTYEKQAASRRLACSNLATVVLVPAGTLDAGVVMDYNARVISIWTYASDKADVYDAIAVGSNAVISTDVGMVLGVYSGITETTISGIPMSIGHRGRDTYNWPENTNMAFHSAHEDCGAPIVELDVWLTGDDKVVVMHDPSLDRTTGVSGSIANMTLEEIQEYVVKSGDGTKTAPIPSLEDVFKEFQNDDLVIYIQSEERTKPKLCEEVNRLVNEYNMQDKVVIFARYNNGAKPYYENSDFGEDLPFIGGDSGFPSGTVENTVKTMIDYFAPYNHQGMPYNYNSVSGVSEDLYYAVTARGFVPIHSTSNGQSTLDTYLLSYGCPGALTDGVQDISDYLVEIVAEDETLQTGKAINLAKTIKQIKGEKTVTCGVEWISGDPLTVSGSSYTMNTPGTATVVYYADVTLTEHTSQASYRLYSQPVDITFQGEAVERISLSILGDSISTFEDWSEGDAADTTNSNIRDNYLYYSVGELGVYLGDTWWYQAAQELDMDILVNNSWSGSCVFRSVPDRNNAVGAYIARAEQLHDDTGSNAGEEPDVIAFFMGTNDVNKYPATMGTYDDVDFDELVKSGENGYTYAEPTTTIEAYAIALHKIINRYEDAEIYCFTLIQKNDEKKTAIEQFNADVKKLAEKFGVYVVDLYNDSGIVADSFRTAYMGNENHPNPAGMDALTGAFTSVFYKNSKYMADDAVVYDVSYTLKDAIVDQGTAKAVLGGKPFERSLTTLTGRTLDVKVTMGNQDITADCYKDGKITIESVTGNITIAAEGKLPALSSIAVTTNPKTAYVVGDTLDVTGGKLTLTYANQSTQVIDLTAAMVTGFDSATTGEKTLTVTYEGKTTTYTVQVSQATASVAGKYRWELTNTGLVSVTTDGNTLNSLTKLNDKSVSDGELKGISYQLAIPVVLEKDKEWYIEWKTTTGLSDNSSLLFSNTPASNTPGNVFIFLRPESHLVAIGHHENGYQNYGIQLDSIPKSQTHKYRLQNELTDDGNMVYLYIDDVKIGSMTHYFVGGDSKNSSGQWVAGENFTFNYMGTSNHPLYGDLRYVQVWQGKVDELADAVKAAEAAAKAAEEAQAKAEEAQAAAETAKSDAEDAQTEAEKAAAEAEAAQAAAEAAAENSGKDSAAAQAAKAAAEEAQAKAEAAKAAAETAKTKAEEAQTKADAAQAAAETAKTDAETAADAAEQSNKAAAEAAAKAAEEALKAATEATKAADEAAKTAKDAAAAAESAAQAAASAANAAASAGAAEASKVAAEAAKAAAEAAQANAETAKAAAESAQAKSEEAQGKAEAAQAAADAAKAVAAAAEAAAKTAAESAGKDATAAAEAKAAAEAAQTKAEAAQAAADTAKAEAEAAKTKAEEAQTKAEEAETNAETAATAAQAAADAAKENNTEAAASAAKSAAEAAKATEEAAKSAQAAEKAAQESATAATYSAAAAQAAQESAGYANDAAEAAKDAQLAQKATEEAQAKAEEAQAKAEAAQAAAEAAQKAAEEAAKEGAEASAKAALVGAQYQSVLTIDSYAEKVDQSGYTKEQIENLAKAVSDAKAAIGEAKSVEEVAAALEAGKAAIDAAAVEIETSNTAAAINRIYGENRFETSLQLADEMKTLLGKDKFDAVIVASGLDFADALSGSYLAVQKGAPILLINNKASKFEESKNQVADYIRQNLAENGTVYILGGEKAVPAAMESSLTGYQVKRLAGANRYETNLVILAETGLGYKELLVSTGSSFADSVSASATGRPILMVGKKLLDSQTQFLSTITNDMVILGGTAAVSEKVEAELAKYGNVKRIGGANRFETSVLISEAFFEEPTTAVLAYARTYPDALCSGPVANLMNGPILLTQTGNATANSVFTEAVENGLVIGGPKLISDATVRMIFGLSDDYLIIKK